MSYCAFCGNQVEPGTAICPYCGKPPSGVRPPAPKGFQGGPLLIVVIIAAVVGAIAVVGIIAALLIPNFLDALQKAKQKRTVADMKSVGTAVFMYATDHDNRFPLTEEEMRSSLVPQYLQSVPTADGWKNPYRYACLREVPGSEGCESVRFSSAGRDGVFESEDYYPPDPVAFEPTDYDRDIVWQDGFFIRYPGTPGQP